MIYVASGNLMVSSVSCLPTGWTNVSKENKVFALTGRTIHTLHKFTVFFTALLFPHPPSPPPNTRPPPGVGYQLWVFVGGVRALYRWIAGPSILTTPALPIRVNTFPGCYQHTPIPKGLGCQATMDKSMRTMLNWFNSSYIFTYKKAMEVCENETIGKSP